MASKHENISLKMSLLSESDDSTTIKEQRERLFKTRRLLLAACVVLLAHYALGIQVKSDAESLGLKFELPDIHKVWVAVWIIWTWALITYLQYCRELKFDDYPADHYQAALFHALRWFDRRSLLKILRTKGWHGRKGTPTNLTLSQGIRTAAKGEIYNSYDVNVVWNGNDSGNFSIRKAPPTGFRGFTAKAWSNFVVMTTTRFGTDYFAPIVISAITLIYGLKHVLS